MRARPYLVACLIGGASSVLFGACALSEGTSGAGINGGTAGSAGTGHTGGSSDYGGAAGTGYTGGSYYGTGGTGGDFSGGGDAGAGMDPDPPPEGPDAGMDADAGFTCEGLDMAQPVVLYLSADDSNSMGSPVQAREFLKKGQAPFGIRTYEFLNYYHIDFDPPPPPQLKLFAEGDSGATPAEIKLQLGIRSFDAVKPRRPITVTFVLDTSGSMQGPGIERERAAVKAIAASLAANDIVSMVTWNTNNQIVMNGHVVTGPNDPAVIAAADGLEAEGGTDLHSGLVKGYEIATQNYGQTRLNRVILISDGGANVGVTDETLIGEKSKDADKEGIYLVGVGAGPAGAYTDVLMDTVTDAGRGAYVYLDEPAEAQRMFVTRFDETMEVAARGVQIELTLPWYFKISKFYGEEFSMNPEEIEPQHLAPSDAMVIHQILQACDPAVINKADPVKVKVTWKTPLTYQNQETSLDITVGDLLSADKPHLAKGEAIVAYAEALKDGGKQAALQDALARVNQANVSGTDPELTEIAALIALHPNF
jgi:Ca-activated chloride channel homolog